METFTAVKYFVQIIFYYILFYFLFLKNYQQKRLFLAVLVKKIYNLTTIDKNS